MGLGLAEAEALGLADMLGLADALALGRGDGEGLGLADADALGDAAWLGLGASDRLALGVADASGCLVADDWPWHAAATATLASTSALMRRSIDQPRCVSVDAAAPCVRRR